MEAPLVVRRATRLVKFWLLIEPAASSRAVNHRTRLVVKAA
jgi:hypothetical protein